MNKSWLGALILAAVAAAPGAAHASLPQAAPQVAFSGVVQAMSPDSVAIGTPNGTVLVPASEASFQVNGMPFSAPSLTAGSFVTVQVPGSLKPVLVFAGLQLQSDPAASSGLAMASFDQFLAMPEQSDAEFLTPAPLLTDREEVALATHPEMLPPSVALPSGVAPPAVPPVANGFAMLPLAAMPAHPGALEQPTGTAETTPPAQTFLPGMPDYDNPLASGNGGFNTAGLSSSSGETGELPPAVTYGNADQQAAFPDPGLDPYAAPYTPSASDYAYYPPSSVPYGEGVPYPTMPSYDATEPAPPPIPAPGYASYPDFSASVGLNIGFNTGYPYAYPVYTPYPVYTSYSVYPYPTFYPPYAYSPWGVAGIGLNFGGFSIGFSNLFYSGPFWQPWAPVAWGPGPWAPVAWGGAGWGLHPGGGWAPNSWGSGVAAFNSGFGAPYAFHTPFAATPTWSPGEVTSLSPFTNPPHLGGSSVTTGATTAALRTMGFHVPGSTGLHLPTSSSLAPAATGGRTWQSQSVSRSSYSTRSTPHYSPSTHYGAASHTSPAVRYAPSTHYSQPVLGATRYNSLRDNAAGATSYNGTRYSAAAATNYNGAHYNALPPAETYEPSGVYRPTAGQSRAYGTGATTSNSYRASGAVNRYNPYQSRLPAAESDSLRSEGQFSGHSLSGATYEPNNSYRSQNRASQFNEPAPNSYRSQSFSNPRSNNSYHPQSVSNSGRSSYRPQHVSAPQPSHSYIGGSRSAPHQSFKPGQRR